MVNGGSKHVTKENSEHNSLRIASIHHTNDNGHGTNEETIDILSARGAARGNRVCGHKYCTESKTTENKMMPPIHCLTNAELIKNNSHYSTAHKDTGHSTPRGYTCPQQDNGSYDDGNNACLTN